MPLGQCLVDWWREKLPECGLDVRMQNLVEGQREAVKAFIEASQSIFVAIFTELRILHQHGWAHADVRPKNIVVFPDKAGLIDWETLLRPDDRNMYFCHQGSFDPFLPDAVYETGPQITKYLAKWDLESFAYSILGLDGHLEGMVVSADERMSRSRQRWLDSRAVPAGSVSAEILAFGKDFLRTLRSFDAEKLTDSQYDELELKIRGFANVYYAQ